MRSLEQPFNYQPREMMEHELVPADADSCADVLKILADETRLSVVAQLMDGPKNVGQINDQLQVEPTLLSHHLRVMRDAGIVVNQRDGKRMIYSLAKSVRERTRGRTINLGCCKISFDEG